jgi:hypothetical protein
MCMGLNFRIPKMAKGAVYRPYLAPAGRIVGRT